MFPTSVSSISLTCAEHDVESVHLVGLKLNLVHLTCDRAVHIQKPSSKFGNTHTLFSVSDLFRMTFSASITFLKPTHVCCTGFDTTDPRASANNNLSVCDESELSTSSFGERARLARV